MSNIFGEFGLAYRLVAGMSSIYLHLPIRPGYSLLRKANRTYRAWYSKSQAKQRQRIVTANVDGINYELDLIELIDSSLYHRGCFEPHTTATITKYVQPGMTALDVGANIGCHTLRLARLVGETGRVIAFEPTPWGFAKLQKNISLNESHNITLEKLALSDSNGDDSVFLRSSWHLDGTTGDEGKKPVTFIRLDDYVSQMGLTQIDFIKLDVDGYESRVLRGALATISRFRPMIIVECSTKPDAVNANVVDTIDTLDSLGYGFYSERKLKKYKSKDALFHSVLKNSSENIVAFPADGRCRLLRK